MYLYSIKTRKRHSINVIYFYSFGFDFNEEEDYDDDDDKVDGNDLNTTSSTSSCFVVFVIRCRSGPLLLFAFPFSFFEIDVLFVLGSFFRCFRLRFWLLNVPVARDARYSPFGPNASQTFELSRFHPHFFQHVDVFLVVFVYAPLKLHDFVLQLVSFSVMYSCAKHFRASWQAHATIVRVAVTIHYFGI